MTMKRVCAWVEQQCKPPPQAVPSQPDAVPVDATQGAASRHAERESRAGASRWHSQHHEKALAKVEMMR